MTYHHRLHMNAGDTQARVEARTTRLLQEARLMQGTTRTPPNPVHLSLVLVKQRVEVKTRTEEVIGVVTDIVNDVLSIAAPISWDPRGFWTHEKGRWRPFRACEIERLTMLEGPAQEGES